MLSFILFLVIVWIVLGIIGFVVKGLLWLAILAIIFFVATMIFGGTRVRGGSRR